MLSRCCLLLAIFLTAACGPRLPVPDKDDPLIGCWRGNALEAAPDQQAGWVIDRRGDGTFLIKFETKKNAMSPELQVEEGNHRCKPRDRAKAGLSHHMALDWLFYLMSRPLGITAMAVAVAIPFLLWRTVLGSCYRSIGARPLAMAYLLATVGLLIYCFAWSHSEFSDRVAANVLADERRWATVSGWAVYLAMLSLAIVLPLLGALAVPLSAVLIRAQRFTPMTILVALLCVFALLIGGIWAMPLNEWYSIHGAESLWMLIGELAGPYALVALPFFLGLLGFARVRQSDRANQF